MNKTKRMKKLIVSALLAGSLCMALPLGVSAATNTNSLSQEAGDILVDEKVEYLADGSYITTRTYCSSIMSKASTYNTTGRKVATYTDNTGKLLWTYTLVATFSVNPGVSATCTSCSATPSISDSSWSVVSNKPSRSGNKATATITMQRKVLGTVAQTTTKTLTITCDANGKLSS